MRQLTFVLLAVFAITVYACSQSEPPEAPTPEPSPTQFDGLQRWLTTDRQERLADLVTTVAKDHGWAAGCVFRYHADEAVLDEFPRPPGAAAYSLSTTPPSSRPSWSTSKGR